MKKLESWVLGLFACHLLLANPKLDENDLENTVKISAMITVCLPFLAILAAYVIVASMPPTSESINAVIVVSVLTIYFGVSSITDRIYDRHKSYVRQCADKILADPEMGVAWARRRLAKIYVLNIATIVVLIMLGRIAV